VVGRIDFSREKSISTVFPTIKNVIVFRIAPSMAAEDGHNAPAVSKGAPFI
jgi:hypothetical protein